jgi:oxygen-dependent protoporphyrinogen oxidase
MALVRELGLEDRIVGIPDHGRGSWIVRGKRLRPVPDGFYLIAPGKIMPFAWSSVMSPLGKLRMLCEPFIKARPSGDDESLASFVRRRLGSEALERLAQPMVGGIYTADPEKLSLQATMPHLLALESSHGSVVRGMMARSKQAGAAAGAAGPRYGLFASFQHGLQELIDALATQLAAAGVTFRLNAPMQRWQRTGAVDFDCILADGSSLTSEQLLIATNGPVASRLAEASQADALAAALQAIPYAGVVTLSLAFHRQNTSIPRGAGFVVPAIENRGIVAGTFAHQKYPDRCPNDLAMIRVFIGGALFEAHTQLVEGALVERAASELQRLGLVRGQALWHRLCRWPSAMAQPLLGHLDRVAAVRTAAQTAGISVVSNACEGVGIPDLIAQAKSQVDQLPVGVRD